MAGVGGSHTPTAITAARKYNRESEGLTLFLEVSFASPLDHDENASYAAHS
jgi:hypothetical protein